MQVTQFPLVQISGSPRERGRQYGVAAADRIAEGIRHYTLQFESFGLDSRSIHRHVSDYIARIREFDHALVEEMYGIAEGAKVEIDAILLLNARTELLHEARVVAKKARTKETPDGCTGVVILPEAAEGGRLIHALNWDWKAECATTGVVLRIVQDNGPDILTFTEAGSLARTGLNSAGIAITANYIESDQDFKSPGVPLALIRRKILESTNYAKAIELIVSTDKLISNNLILSHKDGVAINFECAPAETFAIYPEDGMIVHANHWTSPAALSKYKDVGILNTPDSFYRDYRVRELLKSKGKPLTQADVVSALSDDFGTPWSVCRPPRPNVRGDLTATVAMFLLDAATGSMQVTPLPALNPVGTTYTLAREPALAA